MALRKDVFMNRLGEQVRKVRLKKNLTQAELANAINKDRQSLQRLESGKINPTVYYIYEISEGLEVTLKKLLDFEQGPDK